MIVLSVIKSQQLLETNLICSPLYVVEFYRTGINDKQFNAIKRRLFGICDELGVSCLLVSSTHKSNEKLKTVYIKTNGAGRPKKIIDGDEVDRHIHNCFVGKNAHKAATKSKKYLDKNFTNKGTNVSQIKCVSDTDCHASNYINYCYRQADCVRTFGDFDFEKHTKFK